MFVTYKCFGVKFRKIIRLCKYLSITAIKTIFSQKYGYLMPSLLCYLLDLLYLIYLFFLLQYLQYIINKQCYHLISNVIPLIIYTY